MYFFFQLCYIMKISTVQNGLHSSKIHITDVGCLMSDLSKNILILNMLREGYNLLKGPMSSIMETFSDSNKCKFYRIIKKTLN